MAALAADAGAGDDEAAVAREGERFDSSAAWDGEDAGELQGIGIIEQDLVLAAEGDQWSPWTRGEGGGGGGTAGGDDGF